MPTIRAQPVLWSFPSKTQGWLRNMIDARSRFRIARGLLIGIATFALSGCMVVSWRSKVQAEPPAPQDPRTAANREARLDPPCSYSTALKVSMLVTVPVVNRRIGKCES